MPLFDALSSSAAQYHRLAKMNSIPTTEDLRYALEEAKNKHKPVELPFEHPHHKTTFVVRIQLGLNTAPPSWTLLFGDGPRAKVLWTRASIEVMMIQSKIAIDSVREHESPAQQQQQQSSYGYAAMEQAPVVEADPFASLVGQQTAAAPPNPFAFGQSVAQPDPNNPFGAVEAPPGVFGLGAPPPVVAESQPQAAAPEEEPPLVEEPPPMLWGVAPGAQPAAPPPPAPAPAPAAPSAWEAPPTPSPVPSAPAPSPMPSAPPPVPVAAAPPSPPVAPSAPAPVAALAPQAAPGGKIPLPPPLRMDWSMANQAQVLLTDQNTGCISFPAFLLFLWRAWERFQKYGTAFALICFEIAIRYPDGEVVPLPPEALLPLSGRLQSGCSALDGMVHVTGGEFIILVPGGGNLVAAEFCQRLHAVLTETPLLPDANNIDLAIISIGAASIPDTCADPEILIAAARQAKDMAKQSPTGFVLFP